MLATGHCGSICYTQGAEGITFSTGYCLQVLREIHNCTLPIELVWHSPSEMDPTTLSVLQAQWGPIRGVDLSQMPWPDHHRWPAALDAAGETVNIKVGLCVYNNAQTRGGACCLRTCTTRAQHGTHWQLMTSDTEVAWCMPTKLANTTTVAGMLPWSCV